MDFAVIHSALRQVRPSITAGGDRAMAKGKVLVVGSNATCLAFVVEPVDLNSK